MLPLHVLDQVRTAIRVRHYSLCTETARSQWIKRYILFYGKRHPVLMAEQEYAKLLSWLAAARNVTVATQNRALSAILFLYKHVLNIGVEWPGGVVRVKLCVSRWNVTMTGQREADCRVAALLAMTGKRRLDCRVAALLAMTGKRGLDFRVAVLLAMSGGGRSDAVSMFVFAMTE